MRATYYILDLCYFFKRLMYLQTKEEYIVISYNLTIFKYHINFTLNNNKFFERKKHIDPKNNLNI